jgi:hypothetical protein
MCSLAWGQLLAIISPDRKRGRRALVEPEALTTAAAIDRVVHHSLIVEFGQDMKSVRAEEASRRNGIELGGPDAPESVES